MLAATKKKLAAAGILAIAASAAAFALSRGGDTKDASEASRTGAAGSARDPRSLAFAFTPDTTYTYALRYSSKTKVVPRFGPAGVTVDGPTPDAVAGDMELEGTLAVHAYPAKDGEGTLLGFSLADCSGHLRLGDQSAWPAEGCRAVFDGRELLVRVDDLGKVTSVYAAEGGASMFDHTMRVIVQEMQVRLSGVAGTSAWVEAEPLPQGTAESLYRLVSQDGSRAEIERTRGRYLTLSVAAMVEDADLAQNASARHRIVIADGVVERISGDEKLEATVGKAPLLESATQLEVSLRSRTADERPRPEIARWTKHALEDVPDSRTLRERLLEQRAAGLTWEEALATIAEYAEAGSLPDHNRFLWRVTALLELEPKRAWDLVPLFEEGRPGGRLRGLVLDLLASAGTAEAQKVMRKLLSGPQARNDPRYVHLLQRMGFIEAPDRESIAFVKSRWTEATANRNENERFAAAHALGSMADHARREGDEEAAREIVDDLTRALRYALPDETALFIHALANADSPAAVPTLVGYARSPDPAVREAVADALDEPQTPEALAALLELAADPERSVQRAALKSLRRYTLTGPVILHLARIAQAGRFRPENVRFVIDLVKTYRFTFPREMEALLRALLAGPIDDDLVRAAAQQLLDAA